MLKNSDTKISKGSLKPIDLICDYCGNDFSLIQRTYCKSHKIINKDACADCRTKKRKESCVVKYGVEIASKSVAVKSKVTDRPVDNYKEEILELYNQGYSVNYIAQKLNLAGTSLANFMKNLGLDITASVKKQQKTMLERYGVKSILQCEEGQQKLKSTFKEKYGYENPYENQAFKDSTIAKIKHTNLKKYGVEHIVQDPNRQQEFDIKRRSTRIKNGNEIEYDGKTAKELCSDIGINLSSFHERVRRLGLEVAVNTPKYETYLEALIAGILDKNNIKYTQQFRVDRKIADFLIDDTNLLIEADGLYWHSDAIIEDKYYHANKRQHYIDNGYKCLFFRANEIKNKIDIVESMIINQLGKIPNKIYARKCQLASGNFASFIHENHLMGRGRGQCFALKYSGEIVSVLQIKRLKSQDYEISRFCSKINTNVIGGFSRLLRYAERCLDMKSIKTFIDLRYGSGSYLNDFDFKSKNTNISFKWTNGEDVFHRLKFRGKSGYDKGLVRIWDCGQLPFIKQY